MSDQYRGVVDPWRWLVREVLLYTKTSPNRLTMESTLNDPFREVVGLGSKTIVMYGR